MARAVERAQEERAEKDPDFEKRRVDRIARLKGLGRDATRQIVEEREELRAVMKESRSTIHDVAKALHEAGRQAVIQGAVVNKVPGQKFIEWRDLSKDAQRGRYIQALYMLTHFQMYTLNSPALPHNMPDDDELVELGLPPVHKLAIRAAAAKKNIVDDDAIDARIAAEEDEAADADEIRAENDALKKRLAELEADRKPPKPTEQEELRKDGASVVVPLPEPAEVQEEDSLEN